MGTPKTFLFFRGIRDELIARGHKVYLVSRRYGENENLAKYLNLPATFIGYHGETRLQKAYMGLERMVALFKWIGTEKFDGLINLANPESSHVAYRLGIPLYVFLDLPEAVHVSKLTVPLSKVVFKPFCIPDHVFKDYGATNIYTYNCLDPVAWMPQEPKPKEN